MNRTHRKLLFVALQIVAASAWAYSLEACDETPKSTDGVPIAAAAAIEHIENVLNEPTEMQFIETPLHDVVDYLKHKHGIEIQVDRRVLEEAALPVDTPVTRDLKGISLGAALRMMLRDTPTPLAYVIRDEVLLITTQETANTLLEVRVYPVCDLIRPSKDDDAELLNFESLKTAITSTVDPQSWQEVGGAGTMIELPAAKAIVVNQTQAAHAQINDLLRTLRSVRDAQSTK